MNINALLDEKSIFIPMNASDKNSVISSMIDGLAASGSISNKEEYMNAVLTRESTGSTGIGFNVAIPHGKSKGVLKPGLAFAKLSAPTDWDSLDGQPVNIVFMIAVPEEAAGNEHLQILIALSRKLIDSDFRDKLMRIEHADQLKNLLAAI
ncbi:fructose PTS transporter subunit IIA [Paenibacillus alkaliterrae]|uniref:PTS sugar transporter subunit IIA n=1 Tax=Paenibacillus alkaliterrae TaxID=320909 RepID=UPI001F25C052|nr:fructose PTS transporter subunit IIA [Paenibacillus alkaliterrae]MCF2940462.1 fructose PTS transporter subunit IIA [Paenibacillus alkaliterrae]